MPGMRSFCVCALIIALAVSALEAQLSSDYYIENMTITTSITDTEADTTSNILWISNNKFRNQHEEQVTIFDADSGVMWLIDSEAKTFSRLSGKDIETFAMMPLAMMGVPMDEKGNIKAPSDLYIETGETKNVGVWKTREIKLNPKYTTEGFVQSFSAWIADGSGVPEGLYPELLRMTLGAPKGPAKKLLKLWEKIGGFPVLEEIEMMGMQITIQTVKLEKQANPAEIFQIPSGLREVPNPFGAFKNMLQR